MNNLLTSIRRVVYVTLGYFDDLFLSREEKGVIVFCYHSVSADGWRFSTDLSTLERQLTHLLKRRNAITMPELLDRIRNQDKNQTPSFVVTFDDGYQNLLTSRELFKKLDIKPTVFVVADRHHADRSELSTTLPMLTPAELALLEREGWYVGSHSKTHANLPQLHTEQLVDEIGGSKQMIEAELGHAIECFAYPKGAYNQTVIDSLVDSGYRYAFTIDDGYAGEDCNPYEIPRVCVDNTHSFSEFASMTKPLVMHARKWLRVQFI